jgi:hypothetical protein
MLLSNIVLEFVSNYLCVYVDAGSGGAVFQGSVQTPMVRADSRHDLRWVNNISYWIFLN